MRSYRTRRENFSRNENRDTPRMYVIPERSQKVGNGTFTTSETAVAVVAPIPEFG
jgi:hypothetical protein